jgi:hypothetical protein
MAPETPDHRDFFISYTATDEEWAIWVADTLESNGYSVYFQAWDFKPGNNFVLGMHNAAERSDRTLFILSPSSLESIFTKPEWAAAFVMDPTGSLAKLIPIRVVNCTPTGLLASIVYIDLVGLNEPAATSKLLMGLGQGRAKPATKSAFPEPSQGVASGALDTPFKLEWTATNGLVEPQWHDLNSRGYGTALPSVELHLVPIGGRRIEVRRLASLPEELVGIGRAQGIFDNSSGVSASHDDTIAFAELQTVRQQLVIGIGVTRQGQLSFWTSLPRDGLGPVFDPDALRSQLEAAIETLLAIPVAHADGYAFAAAITSTMMLTINSVDVLGHRNSSGGMLMSDKPVVVVPEDYVATAQIATFMTEISEEIVAQLTAALGKAR